MSVFTSEGWQCLKHMTNGKYGHVQQRSIFYKQREKC